MQRKAQAAGLDVAMAHVQAERATAALLTLSAAVRSATSLEQTAEATSVVGDLLEAVVALSQLAGVDPEAALRANAVALRSTIRQAEGVTTP